MTRKQRKYDTQYKIQAVKLAADIGLTNASREIGVSTSTINGWIKASKEGRLDLGEGSHTPAEAMTINEEVRMLRNTVKAQSKEIRRLKEENEFLEEASAFFAASRRKSANRKG